MAAISPVKVSTNSGSGDRTRLDQDTITTMRNRWGELCSVFTPLQPLNSIWRYSRERAQSDPYQGWKIHLPATLLSACDLFELVGPFLQAQGVLFKVPKSLEELSKINSGLWYGYGQVGKFLTAYSRTDEEFQYLANRLRVLIGDQIGAPAIPFDLRHGGSNIYYRYGSFATRAGQTADTLQTPDGKLIPDRRDLPAKTPDWVKNPFPKTESETRPSVKSPLTERYHIFRALSQRGKGGVYIAFDSGQHPPRPCVIKEGRKHGETAWDGRDGRSRILNEKRVLSDLLMNTLDVPEIYDSFELDENSYLVLEKIEGFNLQSHLAARKRRIPIRRIINIGIQIAELLAKIHAAGWVWRDCKPANIIITRGGRIRPIDFEGACRIDSPDCLPWSTRSYAPHEILGKDPDTPNTPDQDILALGVSLYYFLEGVFPETQGSPMTPARVPLPAGIDQPFLPLEFRRRNLAGSLKELICTLLTSDRPRPDAMAVAERLRSIERHLRK